MFSDRNRAWKILGLAGFLFVMCLYHQIASQRLFPDLKHQVEDLRDPAGKAVKIGFARVERELGEGRYLLQLRYGELVELRIWNSGFKRGQVVSIVGRLVPQGYVRAETCILHPLRWVKKLSATAALLVLLVVTLRYRVSWRSLSVTERLSCRIC